MTPHQTSIFVPFGSLTNMVLIGLSCLKSFWGTNLRDCVISVYSGSHLILIWITISKCAYWWSHDCWIWWWLTLPSRSYWKKYWKCRLFPLGRAQQHKGNVAKLLGFNHTTIHPKGLCMVYGVTSNLLYLFKATDGLEAFSVALVVYRCLSNPLRCMFSTYIASDFIYVAIAEYM